MAIYAPLCSTGSSPGVNGGKFIVRVEDTDQDRYVEGEAILDSLRWLGLDWDEGPGVAGPYGPYYQSERLQLYQDTAGRLLEDGFAYKCYCSRERLEEMRRVRREGDGFRDTTAAAGT